MRLASSPHFPSPQAKRTKAAIPMLQAARRAILLTGTPTLSRPGELLPQLQVGPRPTPASYGPAGMRGAEY
jgi:hypothetical protein